METVYVSVPRDFHLDQRNDQRIHSFRLLLQRFLLVVVACLVMFDDVDNVVVVVVVYYCTCDDEGNERTKRIENRQSVKIQPPPRRKIGYARTSRTDLFLEEINFYS